MCTFRMTKIVIALSALTFVGQWEALLNELKPTTSGTLSCIVKKNGLTYF